MMLAAKHFDPIIGVDVHIIQPPGPVPPVPIPHPFIGMVIDPFDYVPILGSTVLVNGMHRAQAGTAGKCLPPHIPIGGTFIKPPGNEAEIFMGSSTVAVDGDAFSYLALPSLTCQDVGMPPPPRLKKKSKTKSLVLPTSVVLPIPAGPPVLVGGPPTISLMAMGMKAGMAVLGRLGRALRRLQRGAGRFGRAMRRISSRMHRGAQRAMDRLRVPQSLRNRVHRGICSITGHPVDVSTGMVFTDNIDFELPGPIPFKWERVWYSNSNYQGPLGHGWHHSYDIVICIEEEDVGVRLSDGRGIEFPVLKEGEEHFNRHEKLTLFRDERGYGLRTKDHLIHRFSSSSDEHGTGWLLSIEDLSGNKILFHYTPSGRLEFITDSAGRLLRFVFDSLDRITSIYLPHPENVNQEFNAVSYAYSESGDLIKAQDAIGYYSRFHYEKHLLVRETNRNGLNFYFKYDGTGQTAKCFHTWGDGGIYNHYLTFHDEIGKTEVTDSLGHSTQYFYNDSGVVTELINPLGTLSKTIYNEFNEVEQKIDELGNNTILEYDHRGNCIKVILADGAAMEIKYVHNLPVEAVDAIGGKWKWEYDECLRATRLTDPLGNENCYTYKGKFLKFHTDPAGHITEFTIDKQGNLTSIITPDGRQYYWTYDNLGRCLELIDAKGNHLKRKYNTLGQIIRMDDPDGTVRAFSYDGEGNIIHLKDQHNKIEFKYSGFNRLASRTQAGACVRFIYDTEDQLIGVRNEHGLIYSFELDPNGEVISESGFDKLRRQYERDPKGRVIRIIRPNGIITQYAYDLVDRIIEMTNSDGYKEQFSYRADGELVHAENIAISLDLEKDPLGRITKEIQGDYWVESKYDKLGQRIQMRSSMGANQTIHRNSMEDVEKITFGGDPAKSLWEARYERDELGFEIGRFLPGGVQGNWKRDKAGRPIEQKISTAQGYFRTRTYSWDVNSRLCAIADSIYGATIYEHDQLGNLRRAIMPDGSNLFRMPDALGNLFKSRDRNDRKYGPAGQLLEARNANGWTCYEYDAEGNLKKKIEPKGKTWQYHWNSAGKLERVIRPDKKEVIFAYDPLGRRISKEYNGKIIRWVWDGNVILHEWIEYKWDVQAQPAITALDSDREEIRAFQREALLQGREAHAPPELETEKQLITWLFEPESFSLIAKIVGDKQYSIISDHLGVPIAIFDQYGNKAWSAELDVYGKLINLEGDKLTIPFRFPGQYEDIETGLYYNRFRYYDPEAGEYVSQDPIGLEGGKNFQSYVSDPTYFIDPFGLKRCTANAKPGEFYNATVGRNGELILGRRLSQRQAVARMRQLQRAGDHASGIYTKSARDARAIARQSQGRRAIRDAAHPDRTTGSASGRYSHYHDPQRGGGHAWYGDPAP